MKTTLFVGAFAAAVVAYGTPPPQAYYKAPTTTTAPPQYGYDEPTPDDYEQPPDDYEQPPDDYEQPADDYEDPPADDYHVDETYPPDEYDGEYYDEDTTSEPEYVEPAYTEPPVDYEPATSYQDYDGYPPESYSSDFADDYNPSDSYVTEVHHVEEPYPTIVLDDEPALRLPHLSQYHCFLNGAPWTNCGGKPLREFFLDQCLTLFYRLSASVDGLCPGPAKTRPPSTTTAAPTTTTTTVAPTTTAPADDGYGYANSYGQYGYAKTTTTKAPTTRRPAYTPRPTTAEPTEEPYVAPAAAPTYCDAYYEERCLQTSYVSITTATVQCLTENSIRVLFIEKYAAAAATNPVEGPILYLKKLHEFVSNVIACNPDKVTNYPTIWRQFTSQLGVKYWPTAPFTVGKNNRIDIPRCTSRDASGWDTYTINGRFYCPAQNTLIGDNSPPVTTPNAWTYRSDHTDKFYSWEVANRAVGTAIGSYTGVQPLLKQCQVLEGATEDVGQELSNPDTLRGLIDSVRVWDSASHSNVRPRIIAEIVAQYQGTQKQPILEGNGILYFCSFYACRANNHGDVSSCFPEVRNSDWALPHYKVDVWNQLTDDIQECLDEGWIDADDVSEVAKRLTQTLTTRTHICQAEEELVAFFKTIHGAFDTTVQDGHWLFLRQIANERVYSQCDSVEDLYEALFAVLRKVKNRCVSRIANYKPPTTTTTTRKPRPTKNYGATPTTTKSYGYAATTTKSPTYGYRSNA
ncbi:hypothetical protein DYB34_005778 [Aphanomyces astaci]|uniref:Uncharacterized protein n=1 Tax=Aphanomyces astaci TaxID=112090 RepID=A0A418BUI3_APHAT|nr:hypothetical protein DYB34_005778 [Aphanomyces astaci]